ncbi:MAG TPA: ribokinase [Bryobacteraceae bacterium]|jgi:ribokinase|nr:ribokinase [Bryobacteraceae bacterium]
MTPRLVVVGSLNMDFVVSVERLPSPGETVLGTQFRMIPGGKGANQACAAGKLGAPRVTTAMAGRVGYDVFADHLKASLSAAGVDVSSVHATRSEPTGVALISVDRGAQNTIVVAPGANHALSTADVQGLRAVFHGASYALFQLESPLPSVEAAMRLAREEGAKTILDPAPAQIDAASLLGLVDILTPNESEACLLLGRAPARITAAEAPELGRALLARGARAVILKLGEQGAFYCDATGGLFGPGFAVTAVDTTAAGDTFNAALAVALAEGKEMPDALRFANAAAAISVTRAGAQSSVPSRAEVDAFLVA